MDKLKNVFATQGGSKRKLNEEDERETKRIAFDEETDVLMTNMEEVCAVPKLSEKAVANHPDDEGDFEIFKMLDNIVNRKIHKPDILQIGEIYKLVDIYTVQLSDRKAPVGGFTCNGHEDIIYIWIPQSLLRNVDDEALLKLITKLKSGIAANKFAYILFKGKGVNLLNHEFYDVCWYNRVAQ